MAEPLQYHDFPHSTAQGSCLSSVPLWPVMEIAPDFYVKTRRTWFRRREVVDWSEVSLAGFNQLPNESIYYGPRAWIAEGIATLGDKASINELRAQILETFGGALAVNGHKGLFGGEEAAFGEADRLRRSSRQEMTAKKTMTALGTAAVASVALLAVLF